MNFLTIMFLTYMKFFVSLFILVNPIGMIPIFTSITNHQSTHQRNKTNLIANFTVFIILSIALLLGNQILNFFGISISAFRIAGGILIISIAMSMINGNLISKIKKRDNNSSSIHMNSENVGIIPLAMPLIAGPGAISSIIMWSSQYSSFFNLIIGSIVIAFFSLFCWLLFRVSPLIVAFLGKTGINIITRIMGLLLMALGVEFIVSGIKFIFF
ncbi:uncharacterized protein BUCNMO_207 [Buchnera aphidicola (Nipponaphis monzeni)]|uniref:UPF0056 membrane protein n=1 Tax=Buchnera aphidicola (Nipponaphis monzeni) TaxID=2495405 RepID=A0A455TA65_9GAMM|nr:YchE family NAAT transporter [Buchnera aphidicola]BBI01222.1 uncharacterized protein BUCNMO_207 [Buchnera aphidicola (Nipponaphis monzeni)]